MDICWRCGDFMLCFWYWRYCTILFCWLMVLNHIGFCWLYIWVLGSISYSVCVCVWYKLCLNILLIRLWNPFTKLLVIWYQHIWLLRLTCTYFGSQINKKEQQTTKTTTHSSTSNGNSTRVALCSKVRLGYVSSRPSSHYRADQPSFT